MRTARHSGSHGGPAVCGGAVGPPLLPLPEGERRSRPPALPSSPTRRRPRRAWRLTSASRACSTSRASGGGRWWTRGDAEQRLGEAGPAPPHLSRRSRSARSERDEGMRRFYHVAEEEPQQARPAGGRRRRLAAQPGPGRSLCAQAAVATEPQHEEEGADDEDEEEEEAARRAGRLRGLRGSVSLSSSESGACAPPLPASGRAHPLAPQRRRRRTRAARRG